MAIRAVIFDMDGVISDTQKVHASVEVEMLKNYGISITAEEITRRFSGLPAKIIFQTIFADNKKEGVDIDAVVEEKWRLLTDAVKGNVEAVPGTCEFIKLVSKAGFQLGVASASRISFVELVLSELGIRDYFHAVTSANEVPKGKPDPAVFLLAARKLSTEPKDCVVIEDAVSGMTAAKRAGMRCIGLVRQAIEGVVYPADVIVDHLRKISLETFDIAK